MYYEFMINNNDSSSKKDKEYNKNEVITVFHSMIQSNASTKYPMYHLYEEPFLKFANDVTKISKIINHKQDITFPEPVFMEDDKKILVRPKSKSVSISEMFHNIQKSESSE